jgi:malonyl-CoA O-methyltransferase
MNEDESLIVEKKQVREAFQRAARSYDRAAVLQREIADRLLARLDLIKFTPRTILDAGCGTGYGTRLLSQRYPGAQVIGLDIAEGMANQAQRRTPWLTRWRGRVQHVCGDIESLPLARKSVDMLISNLALQWCDPELAFAEFRRVLRPGGLLLFTTFGPDTLRELRQAWRAVDAGAHVHAFLDMHDVGDALMRARLAEPVMDVEHLTVTYPDVMSVLRDLKAIGAHNMARGRAAALTGKQRFARFVSAYEAQRDAGGHIPSTYEVVYGHAWAPVKKGRSETQGDGSIAVPLSSIGRRRMTGGEDGA